MPAVCDEVNQRSEFLTAYAGEPYDDHGRFQALFEYTSMMGELLNMDVVNVPTYDGFQATATALRMASRITGRHEVLVARTLSRGKLSKLRDYLKPDIEIRLIDYDRTSGCLNRNCPGSRTLLPVGCRILRESVLPGLSSKPGEKRSPGQHTLTAP